MLFPCIKDIFQLTVYSDLFQASVLAGMFLNSGTFMVEVLQKRVVLTSDPKRLQGD